MKNTLLLIAIGLAALAFVPGKRPDCYLSFKGTRTLTASKTDQLPESADKNRLVKTDAGEVSISRVDGYRILYNNNQKAPFVNLKVEMSTQDSYGQDTARLLQNLNYLIAHSAGMESEQVIRLSKNGYTIYGLSRESIEVGSTLGTFLMFPGNQVVVYFYFNNMKPEYRNFNSLEEYKA